MLVSCGSQTSTNWGALSNPNLLSHGSGRQKSEISLPAGLAPPRALRKNRILPLSQLPAAAGLPVALLSPLDVWLRSLPALSHSLPPVCLHVAFVGDTSCWVQGPPYFSMTSS